MLDTFKENTKTVFNGTIEFLKMILKELRSIRLNRNFLVFLVFLAISTFLWFIQTSMETLTATVEYRIKIVNAPKNIIYTSKLQDTIKVHYSAQGSTYYYYLFPYIFRKGIQVIPVDYDDIDYTSSQMTISNSVLKRNVQRYLGSEFSVISVTPSQVSAYYTTGMPKKVPIVFDGKVTPGTQRMISGIKISPDSAEVYVPYSLYDSINVVHAQSKPLKGIVDQTKIRVALKKIDKVKLVKDSVDVTINVDFPNEKTLTVKVYSVNCPENTIIRTFPGNVELKFSAASKDLKNITSDDFSFVVDYNSIKPGDKYCNVMLYQKPNNVSHVRFTPQRVQYVMELESE